MSGIFQAGYPFGYLLAAVVYGSLFEIVGWRGLFVIGAIPIILLPLFTLKYPNHRFGWLLVSAKKALRFSPF